MAADRQFKWRILRLVGYAVTAACVVYFVSVAIDSSSALLSFRWRLDDIAVFATSTVIITSTTILAGWAWHIVLVATGDAPRLRAAIVAVLLSQIAKYLPGNVGHVIGRAALARAYGFEMPRILFSFVFETAIAILAATLVAAAAIVATRW